MISFDVAIHPYLVGSKSLGWHSSDVLFGKSGGENNLFGRSRMPHEIQLPTFRQMHKNGLKLNLKPPKPKSAFRSRILPFSTNMYNYIKSSGEKKKLF